MDLTTHEVVDGDLVVQLHALHEAAFEHLKVEAAARHSLSIEDFADEMADPRISKHIVWEGDRPVGLCTVFSDLSAYPYVSPDYFAHRWPTLFAEGRIWYVGFLAVHPDYQRTGVAARLTATIAESVARVGGIVGLDVCRYNEEVMPLPAMLRGVGRTISPDLVERRLDAQTYLVYEFPTPA